VEPDRRVIESLREEAVLLSRLVDELPDLHDQPSHVPDIFSGYSQHPLRISSGKASIMFADMESVRRIGDRR
jgi:hypothetical protein